MCRTDSKQDVVPDAAPLRGDGARPAAQRGGAVLVLVLEQHPAARRRLVPVQFVQHAAHHQLQQLGGATDGLGAGRVQLHQRAQQQRGRARRVQLLVHRQRPSPLRLHLSSLLVPRVDM